MNGSYDKNRNSITVKLSRRNIMALLAQLDDPARTSPALLKQAGDGEPELLVIPEEDSRHYGGKVPGRMQPETERLMIDRMIDEG
jgi:hypothetical protein